VPESFASHFVQFGHYCPASLELALASRVAATGFVGGFVTHRGHFGHYGQNLPTVARRINVRAKTCHGAVRVFQFSKS
jgi:hypothetical protein